MKKVNLKTAGLNGNALAIMGAFQRQARAEGWTKEEIKDVLDRCIRGDYTHLISTITEHSNNPID